MKQIEDNMDSSFIENRKVNRKDNEITKLNESSFRVVRKIYGLLSKITGPLTKNTQSAKIYCPRNLKASDWIEIGTRSSGIFEFRGNNILVGRVF